MSTKIIACTITMLNIKLSLSTSDLLIVMLYHSLFSTTVLSKTRCGTFSLAIESKNERV